MGIIIMLASLMSPAFNALGGAGSLTKSVSDISSILEQARSYAMGRNTYVYVGIQEVDDVSPTSSDGIGRVAVAAIASQDGTRPYGNTPSALTTNLTVISKARYFEGLHLTNGASLTRGTNMTGRPGGSASTILPASIVDLGTNDAVTTFKWPFPSGTNYHFQKVIEFDPQGVARIQTNSSYNSSIQSYLEIPLVPVHGNVAAKTPPANQASIQINGLTGVVRIYRP